MSPESYEYRSVRKLQGLANELIDRLADMGFCNPAFPMSPPRLKRANQVEVTQLQHPSVLASQTLGATELVADQGGNSDPKPGRERLNKSVPGI